MNPTIREEISSLCKQIKVLKILFVWNYCDTNEIKDEAVAKEQQRLISGLNFAEEYDKWYSKCIVVLKHVFPERLDEFKKQYLPEPNRNKLTVLNYTISDTINGYRSVSVGLDSSAGKLVTQFNIMLSVKQMLDGRLLELQNLLEFEVFEKEIDAAEKLMKSGYLRSSGAICGVLLEKHLQDKLDHLGVSYNKNKNNLSDLIQLSYSEKIIDLTQYKFLIYLAEIRNKCDHNKNSDPTAVEVSELITGTRKVLNTY